MIRKCHYCRKRVKRAERIPGPIYCHRWCFLVNDPEVRALLAMLAEGSWS